MLIAIQLLCTPQGAVSDGAARSFNDEQITIGRAPNCHVVLPDGLRIVSRQHARLTRHQGDVLLTCLSASAPVLVNAMQVPHGGALPVRDGDTLRIGGFELRVAIPAEAPASKLAGDSTPPVSPPASSPVPRVNDVTPAPGPVPHADDVMPAPATPAAGMPRGRARLDDWFDLEPAVPAAEPPDDVPVAWATTANVDLDLRSGAYANGGSAVEVAAPDGLATAEVPAVPLVALVPPMPGPPVVPVQPAAVTPPVPVAPSLPSAPVSPAQALPDPDETLRALMQAFLEGAGMTPRAGATTTQGLAPMALTPAWMRHIGELLRASVEGALALLHSRSTVKREMRAEVTVIARRQNNPLKFAPDAQSALSHLVGAKRSPGFLEPVAAVKDAHEDLLVHHLAVVAGMRAAMFELIARLGPEDIVREEGPAKGLSATLPTLQEAALWRRYRQRHADMIASLDDDFETVFGREFTKAYEAQARHVREQAPPSDTQA